MTETPPFDKRYHAAIDDAQLRRTLLVFQRRWERGRDAVFAETGIDFDAERAKLKGVKDRVIADLPAYVEQFTQSVEASGGAVHHAATAGDAIAVISRLAQGRGVERVIKSKSMVSEEVGLNGGLEAAGLTVTETDLGEWLVQLAGERPSHITMPALHRNRFQTAQIITNETGRPLSGEDITEQVGVVREALRHDFLAGQMGISGANVLVAETGTVVLVTNEGNAELVTSIPKIHVVLAGIEKLVPTLEDAASVVQSLVPSATGQRITGYVSWITGPSAPDAELHVVLLDNGRSAMRQSPLFADALRCIRCGACSNICPSFGVVGGHVFGYIYSGAIGLVNTPFHHDLGHDVGPQSLCVQCNACQTVCPVDIPLPKQILANRAAVASDIGLPLIERVALAVWQRPSVFRAAARAASIVQTPIARGRYLEPPLRGKQTSWRLPPAVAPQPFRARRMAAHDPLPGDLGRILAGKRVAYFVQCLTDQLYPEMGDAIVEVLQSLGAEVIFPRAQHCCGLPALDAGERSAGKKMARHTIEVMESVRADYVISGGTSCVIAMKGYPELFADDPLWLIRAEALAARTFDVTSFLLDVVRLPAGSFASVRASEIGANGTAPAQGLGTERLGTERSGREGGVATYHYFCQSYNVLGFREGPIRLLSEVCGLEMVSLPEANWCCGFGGSVSFQRPELSEGILSRKLGNLDESGAGLLVTDNPGCILQLRGGIAASGRRVRVRHTAEVVADRIRALRAL